MRPGGPRRGQGQAHRRGEEPDGARGGQVPTDARLRRPFGCPHRRRSAGPSRRLPGRGHHRDARGVRQLQRRDARRLHGRRQNRGRCGRGRRVGHRRWRFDHGHALRWRPGADQHRRALSARRQLGYRDLPGGRLRGGSRSLRDGRHRGHAAGREDGEGAGDVGDLRDAVPSQLDHRSGGGPAQERLLGRSQRGAAPELTTRGRCRPYRGGDFRLEDRPPPPRSARVLPQQSRGRNPGLAGGTFPQPAVGGLSRSRTTVKGMPYRLIYIGLGLLGAAALILGIVFAKDGDPTDLPGALVSVSPEPNELVPPQAVLEVVLPVGYRAEIWVDGWPITDFTFVEATGVHRWSPSPGHPTIQTWSSGEHRVRIEWDTYSGLPDPGEWEWIFRVG